MSAELGFTPSDPERSTGKSSGGKSPVTTQ